LEEIKNLQTTLGLETFEVKVESIQFSRRDSSDEGPSISPSSKSQSDKDDANQAEEPRSSQSAALNVIGGVGSPALGILVLCYQRHKVMTWLKRRCTRSGPTPRDIPLQTPNPLGTV
jgi:hypothetical protein